MSSLLGLPIPIALNWARHRECVDSALYPDAMRSMAGAGSLVGTAKLNLMLAFE